MFHVQAQTSGKDLIQRLNIHMLGPCVRWSLSTTLPTDPFPAAID